jgi:nucleoside-diphosphate-sugar epimerase
MNPNAKPNKTALVLGATGGVGGAIAAALLSHGWQVRGLARNLAQAKAQSATQPNQQERLGAIEWIGGDAMNASDVEGAAQGVSTIVHAVNPPGYRNWERLVLPMLDNSIAAARASGGARVVLPGTIYNHDPATTPVIRADSPQQATSRKGQVRQAMEARLAQAAPEVPSLILRAGDYFGPGCTRSTWFAQAMVKPGQPLKRLTNVARSPGHSWAYLPDLAEAFARLLNEPSQLQPFERLQFQGLYDSSGDVLIEALRRVTGRQLPVRAFPWWLMKALAPMGGFPREVAEIAPYWRHPVRLDNARLVQLLGAEPATPLNDALRATLAALGCLDSNLNGVDQRPARPQAPPRLNQLFNFKK